MKVSLWLLTLALSVTCFFLWAIARMEMPLLRAVGFTLPPMTEFLLSSPNWLLFCAAPWILWSLVLSFRKEVSYGVGFVFLSSILLAASLIFMPFLVAAAMPWFALFGRSISK
jgi:hypothetical protein